MELLHVVGTGTHGSVHAALDGELRRIVAVKRMPKIAPVAESQGLSLVMLREVSTLKRLQPHPNIVSYIRTYATPNEVHLVMIFVPRSLDTIIRESPDTARSFAPNITHQLIHAVAHMHNNGVMHRDLKPENVLVDEQMCVKLTDFGLSSVLGREQYTLNVVTLPYKAPELLRAGMLGKYDEKIDVWSIGCILHEVIHSRRLFDVTTVRDLKTMMNDCTVRSAHVHAHEFLQMVLRETLQIDPKRRAAATTLKHICQSACSRRSKMLRVK